MSPTPKPPPPRAVPKWKPIAQMSRADRERERRSIQLRLETPASRMPQRERNSMQIRLSQLRVADEIERLDATAPPRPRRK